MAADDAAVVVTLRANLKEYDAALKQAVRSTEKAALEIEKALGKGGGSNVIAGNFKKSSGQIINDARNLQFQLNDVFQAIATGQGVRGVQMQLGQIAQLLSGQSIVQGARTLAAGLVAMVNPINLAAVAFGALLPIAVAYFSSSEEEAKKATEELRKQADELDKLAKKYGALFPALRDAADRQRQLAEEGEKAIAVQKALAAAYEESGKTLEGLQDPFFELMSSLQAMSKTLEAADLQQAFKTLSTGIKEHNASSEDAKAVIDALNKIMAEQGGRVKNLAQAIRDELVTALGELDRAAKSAGETMKGLANQPGPGAGDWLTSPQRLKFSMLGPPSGKTADFIRNEEGFRAKAYWDVNAWRVGFGSDTFVDAMGEVQAVTKETVVTLQQANQDLKRRIPEFQQTITNAIGPDYWNSLNEAQQAALTSIAYNFGSLPKSIVDAIQAGDKGQVAAAIAALGSNPARRGREAAAFGGIPAVVKATKELNTETQKRIELERQLKEIGPLLSENDKQRAQDVAALQQQMQGIVSGALSSFTHDLINGADAGEAFNSMLRNLASQIADLAIQMLIIKPLMNAIFPASAGAGLTGGGLFEAGGTVGMSGRHDGRKFSPLAWAGAPRFAAGGMVGLRPGEMPIIAHRGEIIIPNARRLAGSGAGAASGRQRVDVMVSAAPSPLLELKIKTSAAQAEQRAVARGPAVARDNNRRFATP